MLKLRKTTPGDPLIVSMTGLRLGDRVLIIGFGDAKSVALIAVKPGLTGRVCVVDEDRERTTRGAALAESEGALIEATTAPITMLPFDSGSFDVVVFNHVLPLLAGDRRASGFQEALRVLRDGGRCIVMESGRRGGLAGLFSGGAKVPLAEIESAMTGAGFAGVRTLAEREGLLFIEAARRRA